MKEKDKLVQRITEELETIEEMYERLRVESLTPEQQRLYLLHQIDQFNAIPPIYQTERKTPAFRHGDISESLFGAWVG